jgi:hypothetical protein
MPQHKPGIKPGIFKGSFKLNGLKIRNHWFILLNVVLVVGDE